jgi:hypothetical protein
MSPKLDAAALRCLKRCTRHPLPLEAARRFLAALACKPGWSPGEIAQLKELIDWALGVDPPEDGEAA